MSSKFNPIKTRKQKFNTGKLPDNVGFSAGKGVTRKLTAKEQRVQSDILSGAAIICPVRGLYYFK